jgi:hypothetical protein
MLTPDGGAARKAIGQRSEPRKLIVLKTPVRPAARQEKTGGPRES